MSPVDGSLERLRVLLVDPGPGLGASLAWALARLGTQVVWLGMVPAPEGVPGLRALADTRRSVVPGAWGGGGFDAVVDLGARGAEGSAELARLVRGRTGLVVQMGTWRVYAGTDGAAAEDAAEGEDRVGGDGAAGCGRGGAGGVVSGAVAAWARRAGGPSGAATGAGGGVAANEAGVPETGSWAQDVGDGRTLSGDRPAEADRLRESSAPAGWRAGVSRGVTAGARTGTGDGGMAPAAGPSAGAAAGAAAGATSGASLASAAPAPGGGGESGAAGAAAVARWSPSLPLAEGAPLRDGPELAAEDGLWHERARGGYAATVLRLAALYGPGIGLAREWFGVARLRAGRRRVALLDGGQQLLHRVYVENAVHAVVRVLDHPREADGRAFNVGDSHVPTAADLVTQIGMAAGMPLAVAPVPAILRPPPHPWAARRPVVLDTAQVRMRIAYREPVPPDEGLARTVRWLWDLPEAEVSRRLAPYLRRWGAAHDYGAEDRALRRWDALAARGD